MANAFRPALEIAGDLSRWFQDQGKTQTEIASELGVTQPHLSRILAGCFRPSRSATAEQLCEMAGVPLRTSRPPANAQEQLYRVLTQIWDGSEEDAERLVALLRAAHRLRQPPLRDRKSCSASDDDTGSP